MKNQQFDALVIVTPKDFSRLSWNHKQLISNLPSRNIRFIGSTGVKELLDKELENDSSLQKLDWCDEDSIILFDNVYSCIQDRLSPILNGQPLPRGICGWYYQQFLKMQYARVCTDDYYLVWDGDTVPCAPFSMFDSSGKPFFDLKTEYHKPYFDTLIKLLPEAATYETVVDIASITPRLIRDSLKNPTENVVGKVVEKSFIAEHMIIDCSLMREMLDMIEANNTLKGETFWEKIINSIEIDKLQSNSFSEFETFGTYVTIHHPEAYSLRNWHSLRYGGEYFYPETICERDYVWLSRDFFAISFEKGHSVREDHANLFDNPKYQEKLSARQMLELAQEDFEEGYIEKWD